MIKKIDRYIDTGNLIKRVVEIIEDKDARHTDKLKAIQMIMDYRWGKPKQTIDQTNTHTVNDFNIKDLLKFDKSK